MTSVSHRVNCFYYFLVTFQVVKAGPITRIVRRVTESVPVGNDKKLLDQTKYIILDFLPFYPWAIAFRNVDQSPKRI